jgi:hypothetical protein
MVDPNNRSLNRLTANLVKAEALRAEIASIIQDSSESHKALIPLGNCPVLRDRTAPRKLSQSARAPIQPVGTKRAESALGRRRASTRRAAKPTTPRDSLKPLAVPPGLMSRYNRKELYEQVWKVPMRKLANEYGVSDVALAKTCKKLHIPVPGRGYWAKKTANQPVAPRPLLPKVQAR